MNLDFLNFYLLRMQKNIKLFKALGEETKYKILLVLLEGEKCACSIPNLINKTQSNTSMHLSKLLDWGVITNRKNGKQVIYSIKDERIFNIFKALGIKKKQVKCKCS